MTLHKLVKRVSDIITPGTDEFYKYVLYTSDNNGGFLRTRYCWWDKPFEDRKLPDGYTKVLVTCKKEIIVEDLINKKEPKLELQFWYDSLDAKLDYVECDIEMGYCYIYVFDLVTNAFVVECRKSIY